MITKMYLGLGIVSMLDIHTLSFLTGVFIGLIFVGCCAYGIMTQEKEEKEKEKKRRK